MTTRPDATPSGGEDRSQRCTASTKRSGKQCNAYAIHGGTVCRMHGGGTPQVRRAAERTLEVRRVSALLARAGIDPGQNPLEVLQAQVDLAAALQVVIERELADENLDRLTSARGEALVKMLTDSIDRAAKWASVQAGLNIDERKVRVSELTAGQLVSLVEVCARQVGIPTTQVDQLKTALAAEARRRRNNR